MTALDALNRDCFCLSLDPAALAQALDVALGQPGLSAMVSERCPYLFSSQPVFVAAPQVQRMAQVVQAVEAVVALPAFRAQVLAAAPAIARVGADRSDGPRGVFFGYDFHLDQGHLGLIEINTNAGGAMLNAVLARAQRACCVAMDSMLPTEAGVQRFEQRIIDMFRDEWRWSGRSRPLASIATVDEAPEQQFLYPEFLLFQQMFQRHGLQAVIADPASLTWHDGQLWHGDLGIDLVYNRLTDFYLDQPASAALREAWVQQGVVLTPNPLCHALYADKRHLALFSDAARLQALGVPEATRQVLLAHVPHTEVVDAAQADRLWAARRGLFFKPVAGFGSRAAYRGDKLTKRVWQDILAGDYVAQAMLAPGERVVDARVGATAVATCSQTDGDATSNATAAAAATAIATATAGAATSAVLAAPTIAETTTRTLKFDLRAYAYAGQVQWLAARLYQGQTTNFRTPGGGFAPVYSNADGLAASPHGGGSAAAAPDYASYIFLLDKEGAVHPVPHALYLALARGLAHAPTLAGQTLQVADWYVRLKNGAPDRLVNAQYSLLRVDDSGRFDLAASPWLQPSPAGAVAALEEDSWPTADQQAQMRRLTWGDRPRDPA